MFWQIAVNLFFVVLAALTFKPPPGPKSLTAKDLSIPKSEEGDMIYDGMGTIWISDHHAVWDGDFGTKKIYKKSGKK